MGVAIGRAIEGIALNGLEFLYLEGEMAEFETEEDAISFLEVSLEVSRKEVLEMLEDSEFVLVEEQ